MDLGAKILVIAAAAIALIGMLCLLEMNESRASLNAQEAFSSIRGIDMQEQVR